jgi:hypothetical protein
MSSTPPDERSVLARAAGAPTVTDMPRRPKCPDCPGAPTAVPLVFGLPDVETFEARDRGEVVLGGCMLKPGPQPRWACPECQNPLG